MHFRPGVLCCIVLAYFAVHSASLPTFNIANINDITNEPQWLLAATVAENLINSNPLFNDQFEFRVVHNNSYPDRALSNALVAQRQGAVGIFGCTLSSDTIAVNNEISVPFRLPIISASAISPELSVPTDFPYFLRTTPPAGGFAQAATIFIRERGGVNRAVVSVYRGGDPATTAENEALLAAANSGFLNVVANVSFEAHTTDFSHVIHVILNSGSNVVLVCAQAEDFAPLLTALYGAHIMFPQYQIIGLNTLLRPDALYHNNHPSAEAIAEVVGAIAIDQSAGAGAVYDTFSAAYLQARSQMPDPDRFPAIANSDCSDTYDALLLYAYGIHEVMDMGGDPHDGTLLMAALRNQSFPGASGVVSYLRDSNDPAIGRTYTVYLFRASSSSGGHGAALPQAAAVGTVDVSAGSFRQAGNINFPPAMIVRGVSIAALMLMFGAIALVGVLAVWCCCCRKETPTEEKEKLAVSGTQTTV